MAIFLSFSVRDGIWIKSTSYILYLGSYNLHQYVKTAILKLSNSICLLAPKYSLYRNAFRWKENICCFTLSLLYFLNKYNTPQQFTQLAVLAWLCFALGFSPSEMFAHPRRASSNVMALISPFSDEFPFLLKPYLPLVDICLYMALLKCKQR